MKLNINRVEKIRCSEPGSRLSLVVFVWQSILLFVFVLTLALITFWYYRFYTVVNIGKEQLNNIEVYKPIVDKKMLDSVLVRYKLRH